MQLLVNIYVTIVLQSIYQLGQNFVPGVGQGVRIPTPARLLSLYNVLRRPGVGKLTPIYYSSKNRAPFAKCDLILIPFLSIYMFFSMINTCVLHSTQHRRIQWPQSDSLGWVS